MKPAPGPALYLDEFPGAQPIACEVVDDDGELVARFPRTDDDDGAEVPVADLCGEFRPAA